MANSADTRNKLEQLKKDQEALKAQLAELDTYLTKKYGTLKAEKHVSRSYTPTIAKSMSPPQYDSNNELVGMRALLQESINNSKKLMEKFDYLLDALISSLDDMDSEDIDKTIRLIAESQSHLLDNLAETRQQLEELEKEAITKEDIQKFEKEYKERYAELAKRINELMSKIEEPAVMDAISALQTQIAQVSTEVKELETNVKNGGETKKLAEKTKELMTRMQSMEERLKNITDLVQGMSEHLYSSEAAMARVASLEQDLSELRQLVQTLQNAVMQESDTSKIEMEKAVKEIEDATKGLSEVNELVNIEKKRGEKFDKIEKEMAELETKLEKVNEIETRITNLENKLENIEKTLNTYPIGELKEVSSIRSDLKNVKSGVPADKVQTLEERLDRIEKSLDRILTKKEASKNIETCKLGDAIFRISNKLNEIETGMKESKEQEILDKISVLNSEIQDLRQMRKELENVKTPKDVKRLKDRISIMENKLSALYKELNELYRSLNETPTQDLKCDLLKMEGVINAVQKTPTTKKELNQTISTVNEMMENLDNKLDRIEKQQEVQSKDINNKLENARDKVNSVKQRMIIENRASVERMRKLILTRLTNLENLVKLGIINKKGIKRELGKTLEELGEMKHEMKHFDQYKQEVRQVSKIESTVKDALKSRSPDKSISEIKDQVNKLILHPTPKISKAVSGLFLIRKEVEESSRMDKKMENKLGSIIKQIKELEGSIGHEDLEMQISKVRKELEALSQKMKKSPTKYAPKLERIENSLSEIKDQIDELDKEKSLIFKLEAQLDEKENELKELSKKVAAGGVSPKDVAKRISEINNEITTLKREINKETVEINQVVKDLNEIKALVDDMVPVDKVRTLLSKARTALKKKDLTSAKMYLKKARVAVNEGDKALISEIEEIDKEIKMLGGIKEEKLSKIEEKHGTGMFASATQSHHGLVLAHKREVIGKEPVMKEKVEEMKKQTSGLALLVDEIKNNERKVSPEVVKSAINKVESAEASFIHAKQTPAIPDKEVKKALTKAEREAEALEKAIKKTAKIAEKTNDKQLIDKLNKTWINSLLVENHVKATQEELNEITNALKESERRYNERIKNIQSAKEEIKNNSVPIEVLMLDFIQNMKHGERVTVSEMTKALRIDPKTALDKLKRIQGDFKLENVGLIHSLVNKEPAIRRL